MEPKLKRRLRRLGDKSESFSRKTLNIVRQNPQMIPANIPVEDAIADLKVLDQLRPRFARLNRLCARGSDTESALGSDIMTIALQAYGLLKLTGRTEGMENLRREVAAGRFKRGRAKVAPAVVAGSNSDPTMT